MKQLFSCPHGHQWELDGAGSEQATLQTLRCPVCSQQIGLPEPHEPETPGRTIALDGVQESLPTTPPSDKNRQGKRVFPSLQSLPHIAGYEMIAELGRGGMGVVYKAKQIALKRVVALKMIIAGNQAGPSELTRFRSEAEAVAQLHHPNIVQIYDIGQQDGRPYFSLEFIEGGTLGDRMAGKPLPARPCAELIETLARAIHAAHERGIIHRDLKPANILMATGGPKPAPPKPPATRKLKTEIPSPLTDAIPKITDFGLAKRLDSVDTQTRTGAVVGTPSYMAPEQAWGKKDEVGPAVDIYALGAVLFEMLTGRPPFCAETPLDVMMQLVTKDPLPPSQLVDKVPRDLETICLKCLEKKPGKRYATAYELAEDCRRFLQGEPIQARPVGKWERTIKWARRRPTIALFIVGSVLASIVLIAGGVWHTLELRHSLQETERARQEAKANEAKARASADEADRQRQRALSNLQIARDALDHIQKRVTAEDIAYLPHMEQVREAVLTEVLKSYEDFLKDAGSDPALRHEASQASRRAGDIYGLLNKYAQAEQAYDKAIKLQTKLVAEYDAEPAPREQLAISYQNLGALLTELGRFEDAEENYRKALALRQQLLKEFPKESAYSQAIATTSNSLGTLLHETGRMDESEEAFREALKRSNHLAKEFPKTPEYQQELAHCYGNIANLFRDMGMPEKTLGALNRAVDIMYELRKNYPAVPDYRLELARNYIDRGVFLRPILRPRVIAEDERTKRAEDDFRHALDLCKQLDTDFPTAPRYRQELARCLINYGTLLRRTDRAAEADKDYRQALDIREKLANDYHDVPRYRQELARSLAALSTQLRETSMLSEARKYITRALELNAELLEAYPTMQDYKSDQGNYLSQLGNIFRQSGDLSQARQKQEEGIKIQKAALQQTPLQPYYRRQLRGQLFDLIDTLLLQKDYEAIAEVVEQIPPIIPREPDSYIRPARTLARCVALVQLDTKLDANKRQERVNGLADRSIALIKEGIAKGYKDYDALKRMPDLKSIRARDDFQKLVAELEKKQKAAAK